MKRLLLEEEGLVGALYLPRAQLSLPLVVTLGGFRGGVNPCRAERLVSCGFAALALAYFGCSALPVSLENIPLEYFEKALAWAARHPSIDPNRITLWGVSRGAELALLLGALVPEKICAIVATVPTSAVYGSFQTDAPAWTYRGNLFQPNAPFPRLKMDVSRGQSATSALALTPYFLEGMKNEAAFEESRIPVEKIRCPMLLISGDDDQMWPSSDFSRQIIERLQSKRASCLCTHVAYSGAGHALSSSEEIVELHPILKIWLALGGNPRDNAYAKEDSWKKTIHFLKTWTISVTSTSKGEGF